MGYIQFQTPSAVHVFGNRINVIGGKSSALSRCLQHPRGGKRLLAFDFCKSALVPHWSHYSLPTHLVVVGLQSSRFSALADGNAASLAVAAAAKKRVLIVFSACSGARYYSGKLAPPSSPARTRQMPELFAWLSQQLNSSGSI